jgi:hypothetical protein
MTDHVTRRLSASEIREALDRAARFVTGAEPRLRKRTVRMRVYNFKPLVRPKRGIARIVDEVMAFFSRWLRPQKLALR